MQTAFGEGSQCSVPYITRLFNHMPFWKGLALNTAGCLNHFPTTLIQHRPEISLLSPSAIMYWGTLAWTVATTWGEWTEGFLE